MINMLSEADQTELVLLQRKRGVLQKRAADDGAEKIAREKAVQGRGIEYGEQSCRPGCADARILPFVADVVAARARSRDAALPSLAARSRADRAAMANPARAGL